MQANVICCDELPERRNVCLSHLAERGVSAKLFRGIHGDTWGLATRKEWSPGKRISSGHVSLMLNHWLLWGQVHGEADSHLFFEDDVILPETWGTDFKGVVSDLSAHFPDWQFVFLGIAEEDRYIRPKVTRTITERLFQLQAPSGLHAYLVRDEAIPTLRSRLPLGGAAWHVDRQLWDNVLRDGHLRWCAANIVKQRTFGYGNTAEWEPSLVAPAKQLHGWCPPEKAKELHDIVRTHQPTVCVEIGVFGGKSLIPMAEALRANAAGVVYGIDPWAQDAVQEAGAGGKDHSKWWSKIDLEAIFADFTQAVVDRGLSEQVNVMRMTAMQAAGSFAADSIGVLHIDGNHSEATSVRDVRMWLPKVHPGGWIVMDDTGASWPSTAKAVAILDAECDLVRDWGDWRVYRKRW